MPHPSHTTVCTPENWQEKGRGSSLCWWRHGHCSVHRENKLNIVLYFFNSALFGTSLVNETQNTKNIYNEVVTT